MKLSDMREILAREGIQLTKSLGQNFLHDGNQLRRIVSAAELTGADKVLEIGPGLGPLTELLLEHVGEVLAIEKDGRLAAVLRQRFENQRAATGKSARNCPALQLVQADALEFLQEENRDWSQWKLVSNLPYSVASPILVELARSARPPLRMVATVQWEVARRLMSRPDDENYGLLTVLVQLSFEPHGWFKIPASCFFPQPEIDSACVCLLRRGVPLLPESCEKVFTGIVKRAFSQRRKMMLKLLKQDWPAAKLERAFAALQLSPKVRAESVGVEAFAALAKLLAPD